MFTTEELILLIFKIEQVVNDAKAEREKENERNKERSNCKNGMLKTCYFC